MNELRAITTQVVKMKPLERRSPESIEMRRSVEVLELRYCDDLIAAIQAIKDNQTLRRLLFHCHLHTSYGAMGRLLDGGVNSIQAKKDMT